MTLNDLQNRLSFLREAEQLKDVLRNAYTAQGRQESTPEHTWRLCLMAMVFQDALPTLDFQKVLKMCVLHDLGEAINGDVPAPLQASMPDKSARERQDLQHLMRTLPAQLQAEFLALWDDYENATSPEAQAVKALDKLETILQHNQGANPADFDYAFNLEYGKKHTATAPLFAQIRELLDQETKGKC